MIWASTQETLSSGFVNNRGADQPAQTDGNPENYKFILKKISVLQIKFCER